MQNMKKQMLNFLQTGRYNVKLENAYWSNDVRNTKFCETDIQYSICTKYNVLNSIDRLTNWKNQEIFV